MIVYEYFMIVYVDQQILTFTIHAVYLKISSWRFSSTWFLKKTISNDDTNSFVYTIWSAISLSRYSSLQWSHRTVRMGLGKKEIITKSRIHLLINERRSCSGLTSNLQKRNKLTKQVIMSLLDDVIFRCFEILGHKAYM